MCGVEEGADGGHCQDNDSQRFSFPAHSDPNSHLDRRPLGKVGALDVETLVTVTCGVDLAGRLRGNESGEGERSEGEHDGRWLVVWYMRV